MTRDDLKDMENQLMELVVQRRQLGGFDVNAEAILKMAEAQLRIVQHLHEQAAKIAKIKKYDDQ